MAVFVPKITYAEIDPLELIENEEMSCFWFTV